jgi:hypothetical protein
LCFFNGNTYCWALWTKPNSAWTILNGAKLSHNSNALGSFFNSSQSTLTMLLYPLPPNNKVTFGQKKSVLFMIREFLSKNTIIESWVHWFLPLFCQLLFVHFYKWTVNRWNIRSSRSLAGYV